MDTHKVTAQLGTSHGDDSHIMVWRPQQTLTAQGWDGPNPWPRHARRKGGVDAQTPHDCSARLGQCQDTTKGHITAPQQCPPVKRQHHHEEGGLPPTGDECVCVCVCVLRGILFQRNTDRTRGEPQGILLTIRGHLGDVHPCRRCNTVNVRRGPSHAKKSIRH